MEIEKTKCPACQRRPRPDRLTLRYLGRRAYDEIFGHDRGLLLTAWHLLVAPARVTGAFISGRDLRYYSPIKYYVIALALSLLLPSAFLLDDAFVQAFVGDGYGNRETVARWVADFNALLYLPMLLTMALSTRYFFRDAALNFAEHLSIVTYGWAQLSLISALAFCAAAGFKAIGIKGLVLAPLALLGSLYWIWFARTAFGQPGWRAWVRALVTLPMAVLMFALLVVGLRALLRPWITSWLTQ